MTTDHNSPYRNLFADGWAAVQKEFDTTAPEPAQVIFADYEYENYSGSADVLFRDGDNFVYASGSHCSCYGLEGQWEPETYAPDELLGQVERAKYGFFKDHADLIRAAVAA